MAKEGYAATPHIFIVAYPAQGHINPLIHLARLLARSSSLLITFVSTDQAIKPEPNEITNLHFESFSIGANHLSMNKDASNIEAYLAHFQIESSVCLSHLIDQHHPTCILYDFAMPWVLEIAKPLGILTASFLTQSCAVYAIYYLYCHGLVSNESDQKELLKLGVSIHDLPSHLHHSNLHPSLTQFVFDQYRNLSDTNWIFSNSFEELEYEAVQFMLPLQPIKALGPLLPHEPGRNGKEEMPANNCMQWLDGKEENTVVYVSFGSLWGVSREQMEELAWGLKESKKPFLWVVRRPDEGSERQGINRLPDGFMEETSEQGLVVPWCSQLDVLGHPSVGCFVSHCGWNSTLESLSMGVPVVAVPQWTDQHTNAKFVADVWKIGVKAGVDEKGVVRRGELQECLRRVMDCGEKSLEVRKKGSMWREKARMAMEEGGSSSRNLQEFVDQVRAHAAMIPIASI